MWTSNTSSNQNRFASVLDSEAANSRLQKSMEDVWKDISVSSLQYHHPCSRGMILLDFFPQDPPPASGAGVATSQSPPPAVRMPGVLSLGSGRDQRVNPLEDQQIIGSNSLHSLQFHDLVSDEHNAAGVGRKRFPEPERNPGDRRHKRMIKNRESAARSRARKQAYTSELELEVAHLLEENARLKKQQQQLYEAAEHYQHSKRKSLYRTSTAPF